MEQENMKKENKSVSDTQAIAFFSVVQVSISRDLEMSNEL